jgi:hypothetical protein
VIILTLADIANQFVIVSFAPPSEGDVIRVTANVTDQAGNTSADSIEDQALLDTVGPVVADVAYSGFKGVNIEDDLLDESSDRIINTVPVSGPLHGTVTILADGSFTYQPNAGFEGSDSFVFEVCDAAGNCVQVTANITVINQSPVASDDAFEIVGDVTVGNVILNDEDPDGDPIVATVVTQPQFGSLIFNPDGSFSYQRGSNFSGEDSFEYMIRDTSGATSTARVFFSTPFAFDSFTNQSTQNVQKPSGFHFYGDVEQLMSVKLHRIASEPLLAGYATPGSVLVGRVYDSSGSIVAETTTIVNPAGNWVMHFFGAKLEPSMYVVIDHVATEEVKLGDLHHFRLTDDTYRSLQLGTNHHNQLNIGTILADRPSLSLEIMHNQNLNPLMLL